MNSYQSTDVFKPTMIRSGEVIGATLNGSASDSGWYRLLPDGVTASRPSANQLQLNNLRTDIANINLADWTVHVANEGHFQSRSIIDIDGTLITVRSDFLWPDDNPLPTTDVRYILVPNLLNPLNIYMDDDSGGELEIAYSTERLVPGVDGYSREVVSGETASPTLIEISKIEPGISAQLPTAHLRNLFYRFTMPSDDNKIRWGEYLIQ